MKAALAAATKVPGALPLKDWKAYAGFDIKDVPPEYVKKYYIGTSPGNLPTILRCGVMGSCSVGDIWRLSSKQAQGGGAADGSWLGRNQ